MSFICQHIKCTVLVNILILNINSCTDECTYKIKPNFDKRCVFVSLYIHKNNLISFWTERRDTVSLTGHVWFCTQTLCWEPFISLKNTPDSTNNKLYSTCLHLHYPLKLTVATVTPRVSCAPLPFFFVCTYASCMSVLICFEFHFCTKSGKPQI